MPVFNLQGAYKGTLSRAIVRSPGGVIGRNRALQKRKYGISPAGAKVAVYRVSASVCEQFSAFYPKHELFPPQLQALVQSLYEIQSRPPGPPIKTEGLAGSGTTDNVPLLKYKSPVPLTLS